MAQQIATPLNHSANIDEITKTKVRIEADYILATQCDELDVKDTGCPFGALNNVTVGSGGDWDYIVPRENAMAILGLIMASEVTGDPKYRTRAEWVADYLISIKRDNGAWFNQYRNREPYKDLGRSPTQTAEVMIALYKLGYHSDRWIAMQEGAKYLMLCQSEGSDGLLVGGKNSEGKFVTARWTHDNAYAYQALKAAAEWATQRGENDLSSRYEVAANNVLQGIDEKLYDSNTDVWHRAIDENDIEIFLYRQDWINYAPAMLDVPARGIDIGDTRIDKWIYNNLQKGQDKTSNHGAVAESTTPASGECGVNGGSDCLSPGFSFQASLVWLNFDKESKYAKQAIEWAEKSGLWCLDSECNPQGGWIDWKKSGNDKIRAETWKRYIDTSFYAIAAWNGGYDFSIGTASGPTPTTCDPSLPGVILYTEKNYSGHCLLLRSSSSNLGDLDDAVSSIRINGNYRVNLYEDINYGGRREEVNQSDPNLDQRSLGEQYSSIKIEPKGDCDDEDANGVFLYSGKNYGGTCIHLLTSVSDLSQTDVGNDEVSSVRINGDYRLTLFEDKDFKGRSDEINHDEPDLDQRSLGNQYSSARVEATNIKCDNTDRPGVYLYSETKYKGSCYYTISDIPDFDLTPITNDHLRSVRIVGSFEVKIYKDKQYGEPHVRFSQSRDDLTKDSLGNQYSSIQVSRKNIAPNAPILVSPPNNATFETGQTPLLCWQSGGDSDGDALLFQARLSQASQTLAANDWQTDLCWQPPALTAGIYTWEVQARDGGLATSAWSPSHNFTINLKPTDTPTPTATPTEINQALPDLVVEFMKIELETGGACNFTSTQLGIRVGIANIGQADTGPFVVTAFDREQTVSGLAAGQRTSVWLAGSHSGGGITAEIDADFQVVESIETNNQLTQFVPVPTLPPTCTPEITTTPPTDTPTPTPTATATPTGTPQPGQITLAFDGPLSVAAGETFTVIVQARGVGGAGLYGAQLDINYDPTKVSAGNLQENPDFIFVPRKNADNVNGKIELAASRRGAVPGLTGDVTVLNFDVTVAAGASGNVTFTFSNAKIGDPRATAYAISPQVYTLLIENSPTPTFTPSPTATPTFTATPTPTSTGEPTTTVVSGQIILAGRANTNWSGTNVSIGDSGQSATTDQTGKFTIPNVTVGNHNSITADAPGYLPAICSAPVITAPEAHLTATNLLSGDLNDDNTVDITDATTIGVSFGVTDSNLPADINKDGIVDIFDIILLSVNFGQSTQVWNCLDE